MATITLNGVTYTGNHVSVRGGRVLVDGKNVSAGEATRITLEVHGDLQAFQADNCDTVAVHGAVGVVSTVSGNVTCGDVGGAVSTVSGNVNCGDIAGEVRTTCGSVSRR
ncbi:hypothetical protein [Caballeronia sp. ATUFL_M1_KS5A]|jgi:hypothetical protein|uniref:hypothetical protein n=1 Tax=Caballeronia sp. ATUFL_M1_KS5A TaxID=2921778 RepID=UPI0020280E5F|nr:hypothetical protein [Caballeronia sp. ATUFL_M1_KS5A]